MFVNEHIIKPEQHNCRGCLDGQVDNSKEIDIKLKYIPVDTKEDQLQKKRTRDGGFSDLVEKCLKPKEVHDPKEFEMVSKRFNKMYLYGEVNSRGKIMNQFQQINITVEAKSDMCIGQIECNPEVISIPDNRYHYKQRLSLLRNGGVNFANHEKKMAKKK